MIFDYFSDLWEIQMSNFKQSLIITLSLLVFFKFSKLSYKQEHLAQLTLKPSQSFHHLV